MEVTLPPNTKHQVRCIHNMEIIYSDLCTLTCAGQKIPGTVINAYAATLQTQHREMTRNYAILSSYITFIVEGSKSKGYGTMEEHLLAAVSHF